MRDWFSGRMREFGVGAPNARPECDGARRGRGIFQQENIRDLFQAFQ